jgi:hypothetical protein
MQYASNVTGDRIPIQPVTALITATGVVEQYRLIRLQLKLDGSLIMKEWDDDLDPPLDENDQKFLVGVAQKAAASGDVFQVMLCGITYVACLGRWSDNSSPVAITGNDGLAAYGEVGNETAAYGAAAITGDALLGIFMADNTTDTVIASGAASNVKVLFDGINKFGVRQASA